MTKKKSEARAKSGRRSAGVAEGKGAGGEPARVDPKVVARREVLWEVAWGAVRCAGILREVFGVRVHVAGTVATTARTMDAASKDAFSGNYLPIDRQLDFCSEVLTTGVVSTNAAKVSLGHFRSQVAALARAWRKFCGLDASAAAQSLWELSRSLLGPTTSIPSRPDRVLSVDTALLWRGVLRELEKTDPEAVKIALRLPEPT